jgi:hypothetical protein
MYGGRFRPQTPDEASHSAPVAVGDDEAVPQS